MLFLEGIAANSNNEYIWIFLLVPFNRVYILLYVLINEIFEEGLTFWKSPSETK